MKKNEILDILAGTDSFVSGEELARQLGISRAAVWKNIAALKAGGLVIDSVTNKGYRLKDAGGRLLKGRIDSFLAGRSTDVRVFHSVNSTNTVAKELAAAGAPEGTVIVAEEQTAGRGRLGRSFYSPGGSGIYMSIILRPDTGAEQSLSITAAAAVAVAEAIEAVSGKKTEIKWVNDIRVDGKKACGILTEAAVNCENGLMDYVVVGIGINLKEPHTGFPEEIKGIAGAVYSKDDNDADGNRLAAAVIDSLLEYRENIRSERVYNSYVGRSCVIGRQAELYDLNGGREPVFVIDIDKSYALLVRREDGSLARVNTGEISLRV